MKKFFFKVILIFSAVFLSSCDSTYTIRKNYLSSKYVLSNAATTVDPISVDVAYFKGLKVKTNYLKKFDLQNSVFDFNVKVIDRKAVGYGSYKIVSADNSFDILQGEFIYDCNFSKVYGSEINFLNDTKPEYFGKLLYRTPNWWVRAEVFIPEITNEKIALEFAFKEANEIPNEFSHNLW